MKTPIIPVKNIFYGNKSSSELDYRSIAFFAAVGFFLDDSTYFKGLKVLKPASEYDLDSSGNYIFRSNYFSWYYSPRNINFSQAVEEYAQILQDLISENLSGKK